nr:hypothetical protein [uncultured Bilophila sp.]
MDNDLDEKLQISSASTVLATESSTFVQKILDYSSPIPVEGHSMPFAA